MLSKTKQTKKVIQPIIDNLFDLIDGRKLVDSNDFEVDYYEGLPEKAVFNTVLDSGKASVIYCKYGNMDGVYTVDEEGNEDEVIKRQTYSYSVQINYETGKVAFLSDSSVSSFTKYFIKKYKKTKKSS